MNSSHVESTPQSNDPESRLSQEQRGVADRFAAAVRSDPDAAWKAYRSISETLGGRLVNVDLARHLCAEYTGHGLSVDDVRRSRTHLTPASYRTAKGYCDALFRKLMAQACITTVVFTSGGPASGKSTAVRQVCRELINMGATWDGVVVYDTSFANAESAKRLLRSCGTVRVRILFASCPFDIAMHSMLDRALRPGSDFGRYISASRMARLHQEALTTMLGLDNAIRVGEFAGQDLAIIGYSRTQSIEICSILPEKLRQQPIPTVQELTHAAFATLEQRRRTIPDDLYRAVLGDTEHAGGG
jgi:hypothetical protein